MLTTTSGYSQSSLSQNSNSVSTSNTQYPITKIYNGDTVVIMTLQQGKDMNRKFVILKDSVKSQKKKLDTLHQANDFLVDYITAIQYKNSELSVAIKDLLSTNTNLTEKIFDYEDTISSLSRKVELDKIRYDMSKSASDFKLDLYRLEMQTKLELFKSEMQTKTELYNAQLEFEKRNSNHRARHSAILSGLIVGGIAITGALIGSWMPSSWFK